MASQYSSAAFRKIAKAEAESRIRQAKASLRMQEEGEELTKVQQFEKELADAKAEVKRIEEALADAKAEEEAIEEEPIEARLGSQRIYARYNRKARGSA